MKNLKYCPQCGKETLLWDGTKKWSCRECNFVLYNNVAGAVGVIIKWRNEIFFTRRNQEPKKGKIDLAGGFVDPKETAEQTCERELYEELKIKINRDQLQYLGSLPNVYHYKDINYNTLDLFYEYEVSEKLEVSMELSEISEILWIPKEQIIIDDIAFDSQKLFFQEYLK